VALPALLHAVLRPHAAAAPVVQQSIDIAYPPGPQQQTRGTLLQRRANEWDRQTDGHRAALLFIYHAGSVTIKARKLNKNNMLRSRTTTA